MSMDVSWCIHDLYLDIQAIKSLGTNNLLQDSDPLSLLSLPGTGERREPTPAFISPVGVLQKMAKASISLHSLNETLNRSCGAWGGHGEGWGRDTTPDNP